MNDPDIQLQIRKTIRTLKADEVSDWVLLSDYQKLQAEIEAKDAEVDKYKERYIEAINDMALLKRKIVNLEQALIRSH